VDIWKPDICIYHGNCDDGFGAAWAVRLKWRDVEFVPAHYGKPFHSRGAWAGKNILFVDFSAPRDVLLSFLAESPTDLPPAASIVVLDHHKTAQEGLAGLPTFDGTLVGLGHSLRTANELNHPAIAVCFDMQRSGMALAWQFCHGGDYNEMDRPKIINLIEDRDLWRFRFGSETHCFSAALRTYPQDFETWRRISEEPDALVDEGATILKAYKVNIEKFIKETRFMKVAGHSVPCCNVPYHYASDVANELLWIYPTAPFAMAWFMRGDGLLQASLRSEDSRLDVSQIAKRFGGGGHRNAAGFQIEVKFGAELA